MASREPAVLIVCEDAGPAAALAPVASRLGERLRTALVRPLAAPPFAARGVPYRVVDEVAVLEDAGLYRDTRVLTGTTAWGMRIEARAVQRARREGARTIAFVDWWGNYAGRLSYPGPSDLAALPDLVAVVDDTMRSDVIDAGVPAERIRVTGSPAFDALWDEPAVVTEPTGPLLFLSQPLEQLYGPVGDGHALGYTEKSTLALLARLAAERGRALRIRPHPREDVDTLRAFTATLPGDCRVLADIPLLAACHGVSRVVGMTTIALVELALRALPTLSIQLDARTPVGLPTTRSGVTPLVTNAAETAAALDRPPQPRAHAEASLLPRDATERLSALVSQL